MVDFPAIAMWVHRSVPSPHASHHPRPESLRFAFSSSEQWPGRHPKRLARLGRWKWWKWWNLFRWVAGSEWKSHTIHIEYRVFLSYNVLCWFLLFKFKYIPGGLARFCMSTCSVVCVCVCLIDLVWGRRDKQIKQNTVMFLGVHRDLKYLNPNTHQRKTSEILWPNKLCRSLSTLSTFEQIYSNVSSYHLWPFWPYLFICLESQGLPCQITHKNVPHGEFAAPRLFRERPTVPRLWPGRLGRKKTRRRGCRSGIHRYTPSN